MTDTEKHAKKNFADAFVSGRKEVVLKIGEQEIKFFVNEIGFLASQNIAIKAGTEGKNGLALLVCECVTDEDGNAFTYEEISRMKREFAEPLFNAVVELHRMGDEKN